MIPVINVMESPTHDTLTQYKGRDHDENTEKYTKNTGKHCHRYEDDITDPEFTQV